MERLNEIINRTPQRRQGGLDKSSPYSTSQQGPRSGAIPGYRPLPEQNARLGQYGNAPRTQQPGAASRASIPQSRLQQSSPLTRTSSHAESSNPYTQSNRGVGERYTPAPERSAWPQASSSPSRHAEVYRPAPQRDAQVDWHQEWEEDTAPIRYGDWESDGYDEAPPARDAGESYLLNRASARIASTYQRNQHSMVTRELRSHSNEEIEPSVTPHAREARLPIPLPPPPAAQRTVQASRLTQPLNRSASMVRLNHEASDTSRPVIPAPYTSSVATCQICKGAGYLRADVPYGHPNFGKPIACECKRREIDGKRRQQLQRLSNLDELHDKSFENFNPNASQSVYRAYHEALKYAEDPRGWLVFISKVGCGKTHLAAAIANEVLAGGSRVLFSTVIDLLDHLRKAYSPSATEVYDTVLGEMREAALLVLDDLGAQQSTPWATEKLFQLLNYRYNYGMPTIITTNDLDLQGIDERVRSRMTDASLVNIVMIDRTADYRPRNPRRDESLGHK